jgi:hypothetical protein
MVAIEVDGASHFSANEPFVPMGKSVLRWRTLSSRGWKVVSVPYYHWAVLRTMDERKEYLWRLLQVGPLARAGWPVGPGVWLSSGGAPGLGPGWVSLCLGLVWSVWMSSAGRNAQGACKVWPFCCSSSAAGGGPSCEHDVGRISRDAGPSCLDTHATPVTVGLVLLL